VPATASPCCAGKSCFTWPVIPHRRPRDVHPEIGRPRNTVRRELEALYMLRLLKCDETDEAHGGETRSVQHYSIADGFDCETLIAMTGRRSGAPGKETGRALTPHFS
jgi:hypothetical protein